MAVAFSMAALPNKVVKWHPGLLPQLAGTLGSASHPPSPAFPAFQ